MPERLIREKGVAPWTCHSFPRLLRIRVALYVMLDGFDLGVGALLLREPDEHLRDQMVDSIMPTWDGNETWLIMAGVALLAAFPVAYGILMPAFYLPIIVMVLALGLRGVSFDFRSQAVGQWPRSGTLRSVRVDSGRINAGTDYRRSHSGGHHYW